MTGPEEGVGEGQGERAQLWVEEITCASTGMGEGGAGVFEPLRGSLAGCSTGQWGDKGRCGLTDGWPGPGGL